MKNPKVTIIMPVYNSEGYLRKSIESVFNQTFSDFEFLIIDDASNDNSLEVIKSYKDSRIRTIKNKTNSGLTKSLNKGLGLAKGEYIARMDADDIALTKRLETQVIFLDKNPKIGVVGSWAKVIGNTKKKYIKTYSDFEKIKSISIFKNFMIHPSVMIRKNFLDKYNLRYNENLKYSQDYELWTRCIKYFPVSNIKKYLIKYRMHQENVSHKNSKDQVSNSLKTRLKQLENLQIVPTEKEKIIHANHYKPTNYSIFNFLEKKEKWLLKLVEQNKKVAYAGELQFSQVVANQWLSTCSINANYDLKVFKYFWKSELRKKLDWSDIENWKILTRFFLKCLR